MGMRKLLICLTMVLALPAGASLMPTAVRAQHGAFPGRSVRAGDVMVRGSVGGHRFAHPVPVPRPPFRRPGFRSFPPVAIGSPGLVYAPAPDYTPAYYPPPIYYDPSSAAGPAPGLIQYPSGRYELRGDGTTTAYTWVWVPNPPSAPPDAATRSDQSGDVGPPSSASGVAEPKIVSIPAPDGSPPSTDPTAPKVISIPPPDAPRSPRR